MKTITFQENVCQVYKAECASESHDVTPCIFNVSNIWKEIIFNSPEILKCKCGTWIKITLFFFLLKIVCKTHFFSKKWVKLYYSLGHDGVSSVEIKIKGWYPRIRFWGELLGEPDHGNSWLEASTSIKNEASSCHSPEFPVKHREFSEASTLNDFSF